jgi:hypothetical protein
MKTYYTDYLYGFNITTINNKALVDECLQIEDYLIRAFPKDIELGFYGNKASSLNLNYNLFSFPCRELIILYKSMVENISPLLDTDRGYMLKSWMNVYREGEWVKPHGHWESQYEVWHGFYCANVGVNESKTTYSIPNSHTDIEVPSVNGLLVVGKSDNDRHSSSVWTDPTHPRITLAFDIVPIDSILQKNHFRLNHFIPFKS